MKKLWAKPHFRIWLAIVGASTLVLGAAYAMTQQSTRLAANDLPLATAQTVKHELENGADAADVVPAVKTNLTNESMVFVTVTDSSRHILASSAKLNGKTPLPPSGVFDYTQSKDIDQVTWQPAGNTRIATTVLSYGTGQNTGFIITGQSLKQTEKRIGIYTALAAAAWIAMIGWTTLTVLMPGLKK
jgi:hypothetical protein